MSYPFINLVFNLLPELISLIQIKMKKVTQYLTIGLLLIFIALPGFSQKTLTAILKKGEIRVGMSGNQPPYSMTAKSGELIGYEVDLANALAENMGVKLELVQMPFGELLGALKKGKIDAIMSGMTITPERNLEALFAGPYSLSGKSILTKSSLLLEMEAAPKSDTKKYKIVSLRGSTSEEFIQDYMPESQIMLVDNYDAGVDMVLNNKADAMVADMAICLISILKYQGSELVTLDDPLTIEPIGVALPSNDPQFLNLVENYISTLELSGRLQLLEQIWFEDGSWLLEVD